MHLKLRTVALWGEPSTASGLVLVCFLLSTHNFLKSNPLSTCLLCKRGRARPAPAPPQPHESTSPRGGGGRGAAAAEANTEQTQALVTQ